MADLAATLLACQNPDPQIRVAAEQTLSTAEKNNLPQFFHALATELANENGDAGARQLAGLHFKNLLSAKDDELLQSKVSMWKGIPSEGRNSIKGILLVALASPVYVARHTAAQATAEVASIELQSGEWPEFLPCLMQNVTSETIHDGVKISSLECLGFTSERLAQGDIEKSIVDKMLTTIIDGIRPERSHDIRLVAAAALRNSLLFAKSNMDNVQERNVIISNICDATQCQDARVRAAAYECIVFIAYHYYDKLKDYMQTLFQITFKTIKEDEEIVALQAIEFWSTLCEEEMELIMETEEANDSGTPVYRQCVHYIQAALDHLCPLLTETLTKQDEDSIDDESWNLSMAGATCLSLIANTVGDSIVPVVMPFVQANILNQENWRFREAATTAFSMILEGPTQECIGPYVNQSIPVLLNALGDQNMMVKDSTAWALGRICELHVRAIPNETFPSLVTGLTTVLQNESPRVSTRACFAIRNLASAFKGDTSVVNSGTNALSRYMPNLLQTLLQVSDREGNDECRASAYEAINMLIQQSAPDCRPLFVQFLPAIIERLTKSFNYPVITNEDRELKEGLQSLLCGVLQVTIYKLTKEDLQPCSDVLMQNLLQVLQARNATAHEEAFLAIGSLADSLEQGFEKYVNVLHPYLMTGLRNFEAFQVCSVAVGLVGDIARAIEGKIQPYCNDIMTAFVQALQNQTLHRSVKPPVFSCFSDIALAIGAAYEPYLQISLMMMMQASQTRAPEDDEDLIEYVNTLRDSILEAYTGIVQGLKDGGRAELLVPYLEPIFLFLETIVNDSNHGLSVLGKAIGLVGDLGSCLGVNVAGYVNKSYIQMLFQEGLSCSDYDEVKSTTTWASEVIRDVLSKANTGA